LTALHNAASDKSFPLDAMKSICASIGITCPANHQQSSLLCQLQSQINNMHYLPKSSHTPSSTWAERTFDGFERMSKPTLKKLASAESAHGLNA
jgi:hypothetical protein